MRYSKWLKLFHFSFNPLDVRLHSFLTCSTLWLCWTVPGISGHCLSYCKLAVQLLCPRILWQWIIAVNDDSNNVHKSRLLISIVNFNDNKLNPPFTLLYLGAFVLLGAQAERFFTSSYWKLCRKPYFISRGDAAAAVHQISSSDSLHRKPLLCSILIDL